VTVAGKISPDFNRVGLTNMTGARNHLAGIAELRFLFRLQQRERDMGYQNKPQAGEWWFANDGSKVVENKVAINPEEWPMLRRAIDQMIKECRTT
jgi:hypothetical protein